jgi:hypothetical protein
VSLVLAAVIVVAVAADGGRHARQRAEPVEYRALPHPARDRTAHAGRAERVREVPRRAVRREDARADRAHGAEGVIVVGGVRAPCDAAGTRPA